MDFKKNGAGLRGVILFRDALSSMAFVVYWALIALEVTQRFDTHLSCHVSQFLQATKPLGVSRGIAYSVFRPWH
jgi:hypothetical protein